AAESDEILRIEAYDGRNISTGNGNLGRSRRRAVRHPKVVVVTGVLAIEQNFAAQHREILGDEAVRVLALDRKLGGSNGRAVGDPQITVVVFVRPFEQHLAAEHGEKLRIEAARILLGEGDFRGPGASSIRYPQIEIALGI